MKGTGLFSGCSRAFDCIAQLEFDLLSGLQMFKFPFFVSPPAQALKAHLIRVDSVIKTEQSTLTSGTVVDITRV